MIAGVVLAGGRSTRMGADKATIRLAGAMLVDIALARLAPQVAQVAVSANVELPTLVARGVPVLGDTLPDFQGPLAGVLEAMEWARSAGAERVATIPVDSPFFPTDYVARLSDRARAQKTPVARSAGRLHPTCALWPVSAAKSLRAFLAVGQSRRVVDFLARLDMVEVDFADDGGDPFFNVNTPDDLRIAEARLGHAP